MIDGDMLGFGAAPVDDGRHLALFAQPARRPATEVAPGGGFEGDLGHVKTPVGKGAGEA